MSAGAGSREETAPGVQEYVELMERAHNPLVQRLEKELRDVTAERDAYRSAFEKYGNHNKGCEVYSPPLYCGVCTCGLVHTRAALAPTPPTAPERSHSSLRHEYISGDVSTFPERSEGRA